MTHPKLDLEGIQRRHDEALKDFAVADKYGAYEEWAKECGAEAHDDRAALLAALREARNEALEETAVFIEDAGDPQASYLPEELRALKFPLLDH